MKILKVKDFTTPAAMEYSFAAYPGPGVYRNANGQLYLAAGGCVTSLVNAAALVEEVSDEAPAPQVITTGITEDFVLKALAIAQAPGLAAELLGGGK